MLNYKELIQESAEELHQLERVEGKGKIRARIQFFRLLKQGVVRSAPEAAKFVGISTPTAYRLLDDYRQGGLSKICTLHYKGPPSRIGPSGEAKFIEAVNKKNFRTLKEAQAWLYQEFEVSFSVGGVWDMCQRLKIKWKTRRPSSNKQEPGAIEDYQKKIPGTD